MKTKRKLFYYERGCGQAVLLPVYTIEWEFKNGFLFPYTTDLCYVAPARLAVFNDNYFDILRTDDIMSIKEDLARYEITFK